MAKFKLLDHDQINGPNRLNVFDEKGIEAEPSDFAMLLGANMTQSNYTWWDSSSNFTDDIGISHRDSSITMGIRPAVKFSEIAINSKVVVDKGDYKEVLYGEYPYNGRVDDKVFMDLRDGKGTKTGKKYTVNSNIVPGVDTPYELEEYEYQGKKYVFIPNSDEFPTASTIWNGMSCYGYGVWYPVGPVKWLVDAKKDIAVSENVLASGMTFDFANNVFLNKFENEIKPSNVKNNSKTQTATSVSRSAGMNNNSATTIPNTSVDKPKTSSPMQDMKDSIIETSINDDSSEYEYEEENKENVNMSENEKNPYGFDYGDVSEEDIIKGMVESNIPVFLHGKPGEGKSARVKQYDPDCEIIYLGNATPESLCGKDALDPNNSEMKDIPPSWYERVVKKAEEEPDKIHIVFFDELTNARPSIQGMAMNIILNKEINGKHNLPDNVRIVAAGNELEDSLAANEIAEPVFDRFAHVYIETTAESLLAYGTSPGNSEGEKLGYQKKKVRPTKFHPAVNAYLAYRGEDVVRTAYNGEEPNVDPRKWEFASELLYEVGKPEMLRAILGQQITQDFISFIHSQVITLDDVLTGNYNESDLEMNAAQKYATCVGLLSVGEKDVKTVLAFVEKLGDEIAATFKTNWAHGDPKRAEILQAAEKKGLFSRLKG